ncbi:MAG: hypothetical protein MN733_23165 [Nitrososphaera sp.]|nr:hypothetical protein [Nitrososphaera sp.]
MIKVLVMVDCDNCGQPWSNSRVSSDPEPLIWQEEAYELIQEVKESGWAKHDHRIFCAQCVYRLSIEEEEANLTF